MNAHESAKDFVGKMEAGAFAGNFSSELKRLSHEELAEVERVLIDRMKSKACSAQGSPGRKQHSPAGNDLEQNNHKMFYHRMGADCLPPPNGAAGVFEELMTYTKFLTQEKHLALPDRDMTLCGCAITRLNSWKRITALEGDECERCAKQAFGRDKVSTAPISPHYSP